MLKATGRFDFNRENRFNSPCLLIFVQDDALVELLTAKAYLEGFKPSVVRNYEEMMRLVRQASPELILFDCQCLGNEIDSMIESLVMEGFRKPFIVLANHDDEIELKNGNINIDLVIKDEGFIDSLSVLLNRFYKQWEIEAKLELTEATLERERQQFLSFFDSLGQSLCIIDLSNYKILYMNDANKAVLGKDATGGLCYQEMYDFDQPCDFCTNGMLIKQKDLSWEHHNPTNGRDYFVINKLIMWSNGQPVKLSFAMDITEKRQVEEELYKIFNAIEQSSSSIMITNTKGEIQYVNSKFLDITGYDIQEIIGRDPQFLQSNCNLSENYLSVFESLKFQSSWKGEFLCKKKNGELFWKSAAISVVKNQLGEIKNYLSIEEDITEQKLVELALREIAQGKIATTGMEFFTSAALYLGSTLGVDYVIIGKLNKGSQAEISTLAVYDHGTIVDNFSYSLIGTPCEFMLETKQCYHSIGVKDLFPEDKLLKEMGAESYFGTALWDSGGNPIGLIAVLHKSPLNSLTLAETLFNIFSVRVSAEIERLRSEVALRASERKFRELFNNANDAIFICEVLGPRSLSNFIEVNNVACVRHGYTRKELLKLSMVDVLSSKYQGQFPIILERLFAQKQITFEGVHVGVNHREVPVEIGCHTFDLDGKAVVIFIARDIGERKLAEQRLSHMAYHDPLTDLPNRRFFYDKLSLALFEAKKTNSQLAVMYIDLDRLKWINDTLGHNVGDELLLQISRRLQNLVGHTHSIARLGGDEFALLMPFVSSEEEVIKLAEDITEGLKEPVNLLGDELYITVSIGIAIFPRDGVDASTLLRHADTAMYKAKDQGRNNYRIYTSDLEEVELSQVLMKSKINRAIENDEFTLFYQPKIDIISGKIVGVEALIRWFHPVEGMIPPNRFISVAEECGLIIPLGDWILRQACAQNKAWQMAGYIPTRVAVNISARQFQQINFLDKVSNILEETGLAPEYLELEITESIFMHDVDFAIKTLQSLRDMGVNITIDDFGTGYSSLSYLKRFPVNALKIDRAFVKDITSNKNDAAIANAIITMAHSLDLEVVAEGIELEEQLEFLKTFKCKIMQGFFFAKPMPKEQLEEKFFEMIAL